MSSMFGNIDLSGTFSQVANIAASFQNLDELQNNDAVAYRNSDDKINDKSMSDGQGIAESSVSIQSLSSSFGNYFATTSVINEESSKTSNDDKTLLAISHETCNREIVRLQSELDRTQNLLDQKEENTKSQESKNQKLIEKYKSKVKELKEKISSLQEEMTILTQRYEEKLQNIKNDNSSKSETVLSVDHETTSATVDHKALTDLQQDYNNLKEKYNNLEKVHQSSVDEWENKETEFNDTIEQLNKDIQESKDIHTNILRKKDDELKNIMLQHKKEIETYKFEKTKSEQLIQENQNMISILKNDMTEKDVSIQDTSIKMKSLTDKFRDFMSKYNSLKTEYDKLVGTDEKATQMSATLQTKETEINKLNSKLEKADEKYQVQINLYNELSKKHEALLLEITKNEDQLDKAQLLISTHARSIEKLQIENKHLTSQLDNLTQSNSQQYTQYYELDNQKKSLEISLQQTQLELKMKLSENERMYTSKIKYYENEIESLNEKLNMSSSTESSLNEYKKRAHAAIKKANDQLTELNVEMEKLKFRKTEDDERYNLLKAETNGYINQISALEKNIIQLTSALELANIKAQNDESNISVLESRILSLESQLRETKESLATAVTAKAGISVTRSTAGVTAAMMPVTKAADSSHSATGSTSANTDTFTENHLQSLNNHNKNNSNSDIESNPDNHKNLQQQQQQQQMNKSIVTENNKSNYGTSQLEKVSAVSSVISSSYDHHSNSSTTGGSTRNIANVNKATVTNNSIVTETGSSGAGDNLYLVNELYSKLDEVRKQSRMFEEDNISLKQLLLDEKCLNRQLTERVDELMSFIERTKQLQRDDPDSLVNMELLKTCVYKFMISTDAKDKIRLSNVVCTILKLTSQEKQEVMNILDKEVNQVNLGVDEGLTNLATFATSFFGSTPSKPNTRTNL